MACVCGGLSRREVCQAFGIHRNTLRRWEQRAEQGNLEIRHGGGKPRKIGPEQEAALVRQLQAAPDATVDEHVARWQEETGQRVSRSAMGRAVLRLNWTRKKRA